MHVYYICDTEHSIEEYILIPTQILNVMVVAATT